MVFDATSLRKYRPKAYDEATLLESPTGNTVCGNFIVMSNEIYQDVTESCLLILPYYCKKSLDHPFMTGVFKV